MTKLETAKDVLLELIITSKGQLDNIEHVASAYESLTRAESNELFTERERRVDGAKEAKS